MTRYVLYGTEVTSLASTDGLSEKFYRLTMPRSAMLLPMPSPSLSPLTMAGAAVPLLLPPMMSGPVIAGSAMPRLVMSLLGDDPDPVETLKQ